MSPLSAVPSHVMDETVQRDLLAEEPNEWARLVEHRRVREMILDAEITQNRAKWSEALADRH